MIQFGAVVDLVRTERVLVSEARTGFRVACLVVNRAGLDKADLAMTGNALEALEQLMLALRQGLIGSIIHHAICLDTRRRSLEGVPCTQQWAVTADECGFRRDSPLHKALAELIPLRIEARREAAAPGERWSFAPTGDDVLAALEVAKSHGANETQLVAVFRAVMPMLELASDVSAYENELLFARVTRQPLVDAGAPEPVGPVGEVPVDETLPRVDETPAAESETPAVADPPSETPAG